MKNFALPWYLCKNYTKNHDLYKKYFLKDYNKTFLTDFM